MKGVIFLALRELVVNEFGEEQLSRAFQATRSLSPDGSIHAIVRQVEGFTGSASLPDDATLIVLDYEAPQA